MPVEGKEDTVLGIISFPWPSGCARTKSHCERESVGFPDEELCLLHNINSDMVVEVLRGPAYFWDRGFEHYQKTLGSNSAQNLICDFSMSLDLCTYSCCHKTQCILLHLSLVVLILLGIVLPSIEDKLKWRKIKQKICSLNRNQPINVSVML